MDGDQHSHFVERRKRVVMPAQTLKIGLIGAGRIGRLHAEHLTRSLPSSELLMIVDAFETVARECAERYAIPAYHHDYQVLLADPNIQAVLICTSTDTHARIIEEAAQAGKHIFCEKPIALDLSSIDRALHAVQHAGVKLQIGFNRRFDANFRRVRQAVVQQEIGQPEVLHIISRDPEPPPIEYIRVSGGLFLDMSIHDFDMARYLIGSEVEEVYAQANALNFPAIAEAGDIAHAIVQLRFANGVIGTISNSRHAAYGYDQRVEILGTKGMISIDNNYANTALIGDAQSVHRDLPLHFFLERYATSYLQELAAFIDAILQDKPVAVTGEDGRAAAILSLAAQASRLEHRPILLERPDSISA
jgi:myo-inositol 2-dehydrogenase/D-chiro-inositol 1-dehydrogenase